MDCGSLATPEPEACYAVRDALRPQWREWPRSENSHMRGDAQGELDLRIASLRYLRYIQIARHSGDQKP
jgi:hypothetical protein